jgi:hypothetical protein
MSIPSIKTLLLSSLLYTTTLAFVPLNIHPPIDNHNLQSHALPSELELDTARWIPIATLAPVTSIPSSTPTPIPGSSNDDNIVFPLGFDAFGSPELKKRQGAPAAAPTAQPAGVSQISPVTTYYVNSEVAPGSFAQVPVVYTQTFVPVPDQWPSAVAGTIGLGSIQGTIGQVRSKRAVAEPTQAPIAGSSGEDEATELEMEVRKPHTWSA